MRYFYQAIGECVSQVYEIKEANSLDEAKEIAFWNMEVNDILCECEDDVDPREEDRFEGFHRINIDKCARAFRLERGLWVEDEDGHEDFNDDIYTWAEYTETAYWGKTFESDPEGDWYDAEYNLLHW